MQVLCGKIQHCVVHDQPQKWGALLSQHCPVKAPPSGSRNSPQRRMSSWAGHAVAHGGGQVAPSVQILDRPTPGLWFVHRALHRAFHALEIKTKTKERSHSRLKSGQSHKYTAMRNRLLLTAHLHPMPGGSSQVEETEKATPMPKNVYGLRASLENPKWQILGKANAQTNNREKLIATYHLYFTTRFTNLPTANTAMVEGQGNVFQLSSFCFNKSICRLILIYSYPSIFTEHFLLVCWQVYFSNHMWYITCKVMDLLWFWNLFPMWCSLKQDWCFSDIFWGYYSCWPC